MSGGLTALFGTTPPGKTTSSLSSSLSRKSTPRGVFDGRGPPAKISPTSALLSGTPPLTEESYRLSSSYARGGSVELNHSLPTRRSSFSSVMPDVQRPRTGSESALGSRPFSSERVTAKVAVVGFNVPSSTRDNAGPNRLLQNSKPPLGSSPAKSQLGMLSLKLHAGADHTVENPSAEVFDRLAPSTESARYAQEDKLSTSPPVCELSPCTSVDFDGLLTEEQLAACPVFSSVLIQKAFGIARAAHTGQFRKSGAPYVSHCVDTARILAELGVDDRVVAAGLLHDVLDDTPLTEPELRNLVPKDVADIVCGVSRMSTLSQLVRDNGVDSSLREKASLEKLRTMMLAMADVRVVIVKLADRLDNLRTLGALSKEKADGIASETLDLFCPLASRLGLWGLKAEAEDLCFRQLHSDEHATLTADLAAACCPPAGLDLVGLAGMLREELGKREVNFENIEGRSKNTYSVYQKMKNGGKELSGIHDLMALRVKAETKDACYDALDAVHAIWEPVAGTFKDYIVNPKANGYQSLHTVVRCAQTGRTFEVQIRTPEMHSVAEYGVAAHWRYKENGKGPQSVSTPLTPHTRRQQRKERRFGEEQVEWARWCLSWYELKTAKLVVPGPCAASGTSGSPGSAGAGGLSCALAAAPPISSCPFPLTETGGAVPDMQTAGQRGGSEDNPVYVILKDGDNLEIAALPANITTGRLREMRRRPRGAPKYGEGVLSYDSLTMLVNDEPEVDGPATMLRSGDQIELVPEFLVPSPAANSAVTFNPRGFSDYSDSEDEEEDGATAWEFEEAEVAIQRKRLAKIYRDSPLTRHERSREWRSEKPEFEFDN